MEMESVKCWIISSQEWDNFKAGDHTIVGAFFNYEDARRYLEEMINNTTKKMKNDKLLKGYSITTYWDNESNCDCGASIIYKTIDGNSEFCDDFSIEQVDLFADWSRIIRNPKSIIKKLGLIGKETA